MEKLELLVGMSNDAAAMEENGLSFQPFPNTGLIMGWYFPVASTEDSFATVNLTDRILRETELSLDEIYTHSIENMQKISYVNNLSAFLTEALGMDLGVRNGLYLVSNHSHHFGASAILCPTIIDKLKGILGEQFFILPASIHETLCVSYRDDTRDDLYKMVCDINASQVSEVDRLLDGVLMYNGERIIAA